MAEHKRHPASWWERVDWAGAVAFILAVGVSLSLVLGFAGATFQSKTISAAGANLLSTLAGAVVGAVATYLGIGRREQAAHDREEEGDGRSG
jgi:purine-cytosine permease-like protein